MIRRIRRLWAAILNVPRRLLQLVIDTDNLILLLAGIGISLALVMFVLPVMVPFIMESSPLTMPFVKPGVACHRLAAPSGGNSRSMLTLEGETFQDLKLDLYVVNDRIVQGGSLKVQVVFTNNDIGPIILFMPENTDLIPNSGAPEGVRLAIININQQGGAPALSFGIPDAARPSATFDDPEIHLLQSHDSCHQIYDLDLSTLPVGEYTITAAYNNVQPGSRQPIAGQTADPNFPTQGVWTSGNNVPLVSPLLRFSILPPPTATPIPPAPVQ